MSDAPLASTSVLGHGFFSPGYRSACAARRDERTAPVEAAFPIVTGRLRRFTSHGTQRLLEAAGLALAAAGVAPSHVRSVFGSAHGELWTALELLAAIESGQGVSAPRFVYSVHSTAAGLLSIATQDHEPVTTVAAGAATVGAALLEAALLLADAPEPVLVVLGDEPVPPELSDARPYEPCACAFVLGPRTENGPLLELRRAPRGDAPETGFPTFLGSPVLPAARLMAALEAREAATVSGGPLFGTADLVIALAPAGPLATSG